MWGLGDRISVLNSLGRVAAALCACIDIAPPSKHLTSKHNHGKHVPTRMSWSDYFNITFRADNELTLCADGDNMTRTGLPNTGRSRGAANFMRHGRTMVSNFPAALVLARSGIPVEWFTTINSAGGLRVHVDSFTQWSVADHAFTRTNLHSSVTLSTSAAAHTMAALLRQTAHLGNGFDYLHLRRTDRENYCDTAPARVRSVLLCKYKEANMSRTKPLVVFTDETNGQYISSITEALAPPLFPRLVLGDSILRNQSALARADNYMLYCAMQLIVRKSRFGVKFSGGPSALCPSCGGSRHRGR